jgi:hypothetical protein
MKGRCVLTARTGKEERLADKKKQIDRRKENVKRDWQFGLRLEERSKAGRGKRDWQK